MMTDPRKRPGRREAVAPILDRDYRSGLIEWLRGNGNRLRYDTTELILAREFGFCYGVDRAVEYAYETRRRFPDRRIYITGEIIHNPLVNRRLHEMRIDRLPSGKNLQERITNLRPDDVVLIPAFGIEQPDLELLQEIGVVIVDTTCGSVLNVWKSVSRYARDRFTSIVHGKLDHEETRATCSQVRGHGGAYLVVRDLATAIRVAEQIEGKGERSQFIEQFGPAASPAFDPDRDLVRIGLANQTTMLSSESIEIAERLRLAILGRYGEAALGEHFRSFDTICSATQERQDAVVEMIEEGIDLLIVIGGFNSSNTGHLVELGYNLVPTYHVEGPHDLLAKRWIRHKLPGDSEPVVTGAWLPDGPLVVGVTAGASTPNSEVGRTINRLLGLRGVPDSFVHETVEAG